MGIFVLKCVVKPLFISNFAIEIEFETKYNMFKK